jgi:hypothetical protein
MGENGQSFVLGSKAWTGSDRRFTVTDLHEQDKFRMEESFIRGDRLLWVAIDWVTCRFIRATSLVGLMYSQAIVTLFSIREESNACVIR